MQRAWLVSIAVLGGCAPRPTLWFGDSDGDPPAAYPTSEVALVDAQVTVLPARECVPTPNSGGFERRYSAAPRSSDGNWLWAGGVVTANLVADRLTDIVAPGEGLAQAYQGRQDGTFPEDPCLEPFDLSYGTGGSVADFDGDLLLDLYVTRFGQPNRLLRNNGDLTFTDVTDAAGVGATGPSMTSSWADMDRDGDLDLFVGAYANVSSYADRTASSVATGGSHLYLNQGDGAFVEQALPVAVQAAWVTAAVWVDVDRDGWQDLYVVADLGDYTGNILLRNELGKLVPDRNRLGLDLVMAGMGVAVADLNADEQPDFVLTESNNLRVLLSGVGHWYDVSGEIGLDPDPARGQQDPWGVDLGDLDNDGDLDAVVSFGLTQADDPGAVFDQPDAVFLQDDDGMFTDVAPELGMADTGVERGVSLADLNNDGRLDLAKRDLDGPNLLYTSVCDADTSWIRIELGQPGANTHGVGARVTVEGGGSTWIRTLGPTASGFGSGGPPEVHVGLGSVAMVERITVDWPDGARSVVEDLPARSVVRVERAD